MKLKGQFRTGMMRKTGMIMKKGLSGLNLKTCADPKRRKEDEIVQLVISLRYGKFGTWCQIDQFLDLD